MIALVFNVLLLFAHVQLKGKIADTLILGTELQLPLPVGRTLEGQEVALDRTASPCAILRYASQDCGFCKRDYNIFLSLEASLRARGCASVQLTPSPRLIQQPVQAGRINLAFPSLSFAAGMPTSSTPTTIVVTRDWRVAWSKVGALAPSDLTAAIGAIER